MRKALFIIIVLMTAALLLLWQDGSPQSGAESGKAHVAVSTFALYDAASAIAGEGFDVGMVIPFGIDVHGFEPTPKTLVRLERAELFIYSGAALEPWAEHLGGGVETLDISRHVNLHAGGGCSHAEHAHEHEVDPHYWLEIGNMKAAAKTIAGAFARLDPADARGYAARAAAYVAELDLLEQEFGTRLEHCGKRLIVVNHNAFGYLAERYGFEVHPISGLSPEAMPSAKTMAELTELIRSEGVQTIFFETFVSDALVRSLAGETGVHVDVLAPLANISAAEASSQQGYVELMRQNLEKLTAAMECR